MSRFLDPRFNNLMPYTPGEQPQAGKFIKLNTNESPYPPSPMVIEALKGKAQTLRLYPDPECRELRGAIAGSYGLDINQAICGNGSDELLAFIFQALCPKGAAFADITYGFYKVWAQLYGLNTKVIPLRNDFTICLDDYRALDETLFFANPNAPTGIALGPRDIAALAQERPDRLIVVDEAYVDFGAESCKQFINELENLLVVHTFSKSRNLAGGRVAFAAGNRELIADLNRIRFSFNPYNISRLSQIAGAAAAADRQYLTQCSSKIIATRERTAGEIRALGFEMTDSRANFLFVRHPGLKGAEIYSKLRERGILVRYFGGERIEDYVRISVGSDYEMDALIDALRAICREKFK